jgi:hypothetical protein
MTHCGFWNCQIKSPVVPGFFRGLGGGAIRFQLNHPHVRGRRAFRAINGVEADLLRISLRALKFFGRRSQDRLSTKTPPKRGLSFCDSTA